MWMEGLARWWVASLSQANYLYTPQILDRGPSFWGACKVKKLPLNLNAICKVAFHAIVPNLFHHAVDIGFKPGA